MPSPIYAGANDGGFDGAGAILVMTFGRGNGGNNAKISRIVTVNAVETSSPSPAEFSTAKEFAAIRPHSAHMRDHLPPTHRLRL
jgi:hypothetical protein